MAWTSRGSIRGPAGSDANVTAHEGATDPHPQYLTQAEGDARYRRLGARTVAYAATITIDPTVLPDAVDITATGAITSLDVSTTGASNRQRIEVAVLASGGTRAVTVASAVDTSTGVGRGPYSPVSGQLFIGLFEYFNLNAGWVLTAATVTSA